MRASTLRWYLNSLLLGLAAGVQAQTMHMEPPPVGSVTVPSRGADTEPIYQAPSTRRMAERLKAAYTATDWKLDPNKAAMRVTYYSHLLEAQNLSLHDDSAVRQQLAREMLYAGDSN